MNALFFREWILRVFWPRCVERVAVLQRTKRRAYSKGACRALERGLCAGAVLLMTSRAEAQNLYASDYENGNIYAFMGDGRQSTFASGLVHPTALAFNSAGDLFVADAAADIIYRFSPDGTRSTFASGLSNPQGLAFDQAGNLYEADWSSGTIYRFTATGAKSTFASGLTAPSGLAFNSGGVLFVMEQNGGLAGGNKITEIAPDGTKSVCGGALGYGLAFNSVGNLFEADWDSGNINEFTPDCVESTFASALRFPWGLAFNSANELFVSDRATWQIYKFSQDGTHSIFATGSGYGFDELAFAPVPVLGIALASPPNAASFCSGKDVLLAALVTNNQPVVTVDFYAGDTLLGSATSTPFQFNWPAPQVGTYTLSARVRDVQGNMAVSTSVNITVSPQCSPVAIVRPKPDPEIDALASYLLELGLGSQVFDQEGLSTNLLSGFKLVIWDDVGVATNELTASTVDVLNGVYSSGVPLYLIGEHLVSASTNLPQSQQNEWMDMTHLGAAPGGTGDGTITITNPESFSNPILWGQFGAISDFSYPPRIEMATNDSLSELFGQSAGASALLTYPPVTSPGPTPVVVQDFRALPPDDPGATNLLADLFKNSVCWLTGCGYCQDVSLGLEGVQTNDVVGAGQAMSYTLIASCSGECPPLGVRLTNSLPAGFLFLGATNEQGSWIYDSVHRQVVFSIGLMPKDGIADLGVTVAPMQSGTFTNAAVIRLSLNPTNEMLLPMDPPLITTVVPVTNVIPALLSLSLLSPTGVQLSLSGQTGLVYRIESSVDLVHWDFAMPAFGPAWTQTFLPWPGTNAPVQFYRAGAPQ